MNESTKFMIFEL